MKPIPFSPEIYIRDSDLGFLSLAAMVITQAVEDVRIYLTTPKLGKRDSKQNQIHAETDERKRATEAHAAARWLQSQACKELVNLLADCGHAVPMKRFFRELQALKQPPKPQP